MVNTVTFHRGDVRDVMATMPDSSVDLLVTSPPFLALRSYLPADHPDKHREIGSEATPAAFLDTMLELSAEWRRLVTATGSICVEIGDTYSGVGGTSTTPNPAYGADRFHERATGDLLAAGNGWRKAADLAHWPLAKSLCGIPTLYAWSLAYGRNLLTGADSPAGRWRIRNLLTWTRPNPPVGALGDKYRPATSFVTVACASDRRWFDLDAVRTEHLTADALTRPRAIYDSEQRPSGGDRTSGNGSTSNPAGAPPLDWWDDACPTCRGNGCDPSVCIRPSCTNDRHPPCPQCHGFGSTPDWQPLRRLPTAPYKGSTTTARRVPCGPDDGGERTTSPDCPTHGDRPAPAPTAQRDGHESAPPVASLRTSRTAPRHATEQPHADATNDANPDHSGSSPDPTSAPSDRERARAANPRDTGSNRTAPAPSTDRPGTPSAQSLDGTARTSTSPSSDTPHPDRSESNTATADSPEHHPDMSPRTVDIDTLETPCTCSFHKTVTESSSHYAAYPVTLPRRLIESMCPREVCAVCGEARRRITKTVNAVQLEQHRHERGERRENSTGVNVWKQITGATSSDITTLGWSDCGHDRYRPGVVFDPFAGSGTTAVAAALCGRDAVLIDLDARNVDLCRRRLAETMLIVSEHVDGDTVTWTVRHDMPGTKGEHPDQLNLFTA